MISIPKIESIKTLTPIQKGIIKDQIRLSEESTGEIVYDINIIYNLLYNSGVKNKLSRVTINIFCIRESKRLRSYLKSQENKVKRAKKNPLLYRAYSLLNSAKTRTKKKEQKLGKELPFNLDIKWILTKLKKGTCEISGVPFVIKEYEHNEDYKHVHPRAPSLDRIDSNKHYTKDNVRVICDCLNKMFGPHNDDDIYPVVYQYIQSNSEYHKPVYDWSTVSIS